jgi:hypothetical protein
MWNECHLWIPIGSMVQIYLFCLIKHTVSPSHYYQASIYTVFASNDLFVITTLIICNSNNGVLYVTSHHIINPKISFVLGCWVGRKKCCYGKWFPTDCLFQWTNARKVDYFCDASKIAKTKIQWLKWIRLWWFRCFSHCLYYNA